MPQALFFGVHLDKADEGLVAAGEAQVVEGDIVNWEDRGGRAKLWRHVTNRCSVGQRHCGNAFAVKLNELAYHTVFTQHLRDGKDDVGGGCTRGNLARQLEAHNLWDQHRNRLAEHRGLSLNTANTPAEHSQAVHHRGVRVGTHASVRVGNGLAVFFLGEHGTSEVFDIHLVDNARTRWNHTEVFKRVLAPTQELVAFAVTLIFQLDVTSKCTLRAERVDLYRVVYHEFSRVQRVDLVRVTAQVSYGLTHGCKVHHAGHTREVLKYYACWGELDFRVRIGRRIPVNQGLNVFFSGVRTVFGTKKVFCQNLQSIR